MQRICPNPMPWAEAFKRLTQFANSHSCKPPLPPKPLILAGWAYSNDVDKMHRWEETVAWASNNGCQELVTGIPDNDFYLVAKPTSYTVGPTGGPMHRPWDFDTKLRPPSEKVEHYFDLLKSRWSEIVGPALASISRPLTFTGKKARRLLVAADSCSSPPWGGWSYITPLEADRRTFTQFRSAINMAIAPHEVDHIDFTTGP